MALAVEALLDARSVVAADAPGLDRLPASETTRKLRAFRYSIRKSTGTDELAVLAPSQRSSSVTCWPDLVEIRRFDCADCLVIGLT